MFGGLEERRVNVSVHELSIAKIFHDCILFLSQRDYAIYISQ